MSAAARIGPPPGPPPFDCETYPVFRETFLVYLVAPEVKEALNAFGLVLYGLALQSVQAAPPAWPESPTRAEVRCCCHGPAADAGLSPPSSRTRARAWRRHGDGGYRPLPGRWTTAARLHGLASPGAFLAWAGDVVLAMQHAWEDANHAHYDSVHPAGFAEESRRREARAQERERRAAQ